MAHCAIQCGRAYCSLSVVAGGRSRHRPSFIGHLSPGHNPDPQFARLAEVVDLAEEGWDLEDLVDCWEDFFFSFFWNLCFISRVSQTYGRYKAI